MSIIGSLDKYLSGAYKYAKGTSKVIPSETKAGQLGMLPSGFGVVKSAPKSNIRGVANSFTKPPFESTSMGRAISGSGARLARQQELLQKRKAIREKAMAAKPKPGQFYPAPPVQRRVGPLTAGEQNVDDLFGVPWGK